MTEEWTPARWTPTRPDTAISNAARMYDYYLGGTNNFAADRAAADKVLEISPQTSVLARENRAFLGRAVRFLVRDAGIRQFVDIGAGLPTRANVHEVAQQTAPDVKVVYVDNDPAVLTHSRAMLSGDDDTTIIAADLRRPDELLAEPELRRLIDFDRPVAVLLVAVLHCLSEDDLPGQVVARLRDALAPGSFVAISHITHVDEAERAETGAEVYQQSNSAMILRSREEILGFFDGFDLLEPGLVAPHEWRPDSFVARPALPTWVIGGVGRKS